MGRLDAGKRVRVIDEVVLDHIAVCQPGQAVNQDTYLQVVGVVGDDHRCTVETNEKVNVNQGL